MLAAWLLVSYFSFDSSFNSLYDWKIFFKKPIKPNSEVIVKGEVKEKIDSIEVIIIKTEIVDNDEIAIDGEAKVKIMEK